MNANFIMQKRFIEFILILGLFTGCSETVTKSQDNDVNILEVSDTIYIVDITGKKWDVTHAKNRYGMDPSLYQYGIGPFAITPVTEPVMLQSGDPGYPEFDDEGLVLGVSMEGEVRAYPLDSLRCHEVVNDRIGNKYVAPAY